MAGGAGAAGGLKGIEVASAQLATWGERVLEAAQLERWGERTLEAQSLEALFAER